MQSTVRYSSSTVYYSGGRHIIFLPFPSFFGPPHRTTDTLLYCTFLGGTNSTSTKQA